MQHEMREQYGGNRQCCCRGCRDRPRARPIPLLPGGETYTRLACESVMGCVDVRLSHSLSSSRTLTLYLSLSLSRSLCVLRRRRCRADAVGDAALAFAWLRRFFQCPQQDARAKQGIALSPGA